MIEFDPELPAWDGGSLHVSSIEWERVLVTIRATLKLERAVPGELSFAMVDGMRAYPLAAVDEGEGVYRFQLNVTSFAGRQAIPNGTWRIHALVNGLPGPVGEYDGSDLVALDEASRVFLYSGNRNVMTVSFGIAEGSEEEDSDKLDFLIRTYHLLRPRVRSKGFHPFKQVMNLLIGAATKQRYAGWIFGFVHRWIGPRPGRILFASDQRPKIEGNLRRVQERMIERGLDKQFDLRYSFRLPKTTGWFTTIRILYLMATSEIVLLDDYFGLLKSVRLDDRTRIIQLWHAGSGFKSVGFSRFGQPGSPRLWHPHRQYTYAITGSTHLVPVYAEAFGIEEGAIIPTGLPRVDWFLDEERTEQFKCDFYREFPQLKGKRIILFAPTFRGRSIHKAFYDFDTIDFDALYETCGPETVVLFRMHHFVKVNTPIPEKYKDRFFDFTRYPDGLNLLHVTDLLITDYSSIIYEYSLLDRPMLFFVPDKVSYAATRGFHRDYDETAPGRVCMTFAEVIDAITTGEYEQEKVARFRAENFDQIDTGAADRVIDRLILDDPRSAQAGTPMQLADQAESESEGDTSIEQEEAEDRV